MRTSILLLLFATAACQGEASPDLVVGHRSTLLRRPVSTAPVAAEPTGHASHATRVPATQATPVPIAPATAQPTIVYPPTTLVPTFERARACTNRRFIATVATPTGSCPAPLRTSVHSATGQPVSHTAWAVKSSALRPVRAEFAVMHARAAQRLCQYQSVANTAIDTSSLPTGIDLHPDCGGVVALSEIDDVVADLAPQAERTYRAHMSAIDRDGMPLALPRLARAAQTVEVALIDSSDDTTTPQLYPPSGEWIHGRAMGLAIHRLTCPDGAPSARSECVVRFTSQKVLTEDSGYEASDPDKPLSQWGYLDRVSEGIAAAVDGFEARKGTPGAAQHLVINISLGYDPEWSVDAAGGINAPTEKLAAALHRATCAGALVIAASGNTSFGPSDASGYRNAPMYPAAFMPKTDVNCAQGSARDRLVYALGAVDERDMPVQNMRREALPELAAMGAGVAFDNTTSPANPSAVGMPRMTGSSLGAAGGSAVAATVWAYLPELSPREVMDIVRDTALMLGWQGIGQPRATPGPRFCFSEKCSNASSSHSDNMSRRISLCNALDRALAMRCAQGEQDACAASTALDACTGITPPAYVGRLDDYDLSLLETLGGQHILTPTLAELTQAAPAVCEYNGKYRGNPGSTPTQAAHWCPQKIYETNARQPYSLHTAPGRDGCSACAIAVRGSDSTYFYAGLDAALQAQIVSSTLTVAGQRFLLGSALSGLATYPTPLAVTTEDEVETGEIVAIKLPITIAPPPSPTAFSGWSSQAELSHVLTNGSTAVSTVPVHF